MMNNFFSSAFLFAAIANATKLVPDKGSSTPSADYMFLSQADAWASAYSSGNECWRTRDRIMQPPIDGVDFYRLINRKKWWYEERDEDFTHGS